MLVLQVPNVFNCSASIGEGLIDCRMPKDNKKSNFLLRSCCYGVVSFLLIAHYYLYERAICNKISFHITRSSTIIKSWILYSPCATVKTFRYGVVNLKCTPSTSGKSSVILKKIFMGYLHSLLLKLWRISSNSNKKKK